jgi:hypothetical protein
MAWCLAFEEGAVAAAARPGASPRDGFNAALVAASRGDADLADLLW